MDKKLSIGIVGAGMGGLTAAIALIGMGHDVTIFEQAREFGRVGADINLTPNAVHVLDRIGIGERLRATAARPTHRISRMWDTGEETSRLEMSDTAEEKYGAPQLTIHRADLLSALEEKIDPARFRMGWKATAVEETADAVSVTFANGETVSFDVVIGADGIHSAVRGAVFGPENPQFTGLVSWRATFPREKAADLPNLDAFTKWWGPEPSRQIVTFPLTAGREIFVFATTPQDDWREESWTTPGDIAELRAAYADFNPEARRLLDACDSVTKSALHVRDPLPRWSTGRVTLLGDAAHPMTPFMAQGACQAIEDAIVLARALERADGAGVPNALKRYEAARKERTAKIQIASRGNEWLKKGGNADWVYGYDAWQVAV
ncbi:FAD-dependent monooxygenase [Zhengella sp. ZM62]|uniref:FAD-dependent monooxygenase n=1 Tax=Zhengella sedimenti TaxID=3390035 RepID=UPI003975AA16